MKNETYQEISGTETHKAPNPNEKWDRVWHNKNKLLTSLYKYSTGGKTGYTVRAKERWYQLHQRAEWILLW